VTKDDKAALLERLLSAVAPSSRNYFRRYSQAFLDWVEDRPKTTEGDVKLTIAPDPADKVQGAHRLLDAAEPNFNIKSDENQSEGAVVADEIKQFVKTMWQASGRFYGKPIESDLSLQALLYSQCHLGVVSMADLLTEAERSGDPIQVMRVKRAMQSTPYLPLATSTGTGTAEMVRSESL